MAIAKKPRKTKKDVAPNPESITYELAGLTESQQWILMFDGSYRVHPAHETKFIETMGAVSKREPLTKVLWMDVVLK